MTPRAEDVYRLTLHEAYTQMAGEPFFFRPWEIARLTDYQIDHLYRLPAVRRAEEFRKMRDGTAALESAPPPAPEAAGGLPDRAALIDLLVRWGARTRADAEREADARLAAWTPDAG